MAALSDIIVPAEQFGRGEINMLKWFGIIFMLVSAGLMISVLPYAGNIPEFFSLPSMPRMLFIFTAGLVIYFFGRSRTKK
jgi:hypothetical protein